MKTIICPYEYEQKSNCSLDKTYGECDEPLQSIIPSHHGDLGYKKDRIVHLLYNGEDKDSILQLLPISGTEYDHIIRELQDDFRYYESLQYLITAIF